ncbi:putative sodium- and chloride-dependent neurotransmitter transporter [Danaus plexippus plexippus]|uniref:Sodium- and chloride-dependent neurotransmitter transporter n=1 Tax=Danaus plexippus plexippus TaxID=278856 RepID=A0A212FIL1_DANPL|nr:putative sodium- and chloride-dependent neurotransmitter transporter [Danaus plexippus plexippus]
MSESLSSVTKTVTETVDTESTEDNLIVDRWTNNISYRQLVMSSCIGIVQLWWQPYIHDFRKLVPFLFLYNVFSVFFAYPAFYLELALGVVTKKGVLNCWDLAPVARGLGLAMLILCTFTALSLSAVSSWCLALVVHSFHSFLPWLHCASTANPPCAARHRPLPAGSETPPQSFFFNFVLKLKRDGLHGGLGSIVSELSVYYVISWILVYFIACKKIYSYSKLVLFKDSLAFFVLVWSAFGVIRLKGSSRMFYDCDWNVLFESFQIWREALEFAFIQMSVSQGTLIMLGSYCPKQKRMLGNTSVFAFGVSKISCSATALILGGAHGALNWDYDNNSTHIVKGSSASIIIWADFVARAPGSQFWSILTFFTLFVLSVCSTGGLYILNFLLTWPVTKPRIPIAAVVAFVVTYQYGQSTFCEDVFYAVGEYPCVFLRVCWALTPIFLLITFVSGMASSPVPESVAGWSLVMTSLLPLAVLTFLFLVYKFRVRNIVATEK